MAYVLNADLTMGYIQILITRVGFTDATDQYPDYGEVLVIRDLNEQDTFYNSLSSARDAMILAYMIQQNS
jgi:hypothetical protein